MLTNYRGWGGGARPPYGPRLRWNVWEVPRKENLLLILCGRGVGGSDYVNCKGSVWEHSKLQILVPICRCDTKTVFYSAVNSRMNFQCANNCRRVCCGNLYKKKILWKFIHNSVFPRFSAFRINNISPGGAHTKRPWRVPYSLDLFRYSKCLPQQAEVRGELSYLAPLGSENISAPYF